MHTFEDIQSNKDEFKNGFTGKYFFVYHMFTNIENY